jgi:OFA family oxalate/formate antiporter-like MFS transporter
VRSLLSNAVCRVSRCTYSSGGVTEMANGLRRDRWWQLTFGCIAMMAISSPQYVWTLFVGPIGKALGANLAALQVTFLLLIVLQTFLSPFQAYLVERFGPRLLISIGAALNGLSWVLAANASSLFGLYLTYGVLGGLGTGVIYVGVVGLMVRWFPDRRGLAAGVVAAGYGAGAIITTFPISAMLDASGYARTLVTFGIIQGIVGIAAAQGLRNPPASPPRAARAPGSAGAARQTQHSFTPGEMVRTPGFWLFFIMMSLMSTSGLMIVANVGPFAKEYGVATSLVWGVAALPLSLTISRFTNGLTRPFFGWISDRIGRETTMCIAFSGEAAAIVLLMLCLHNPALFVVLTGVAFFGWGEIFSLFPSTLTDMFGPEHATTNYGILYIAQGVGSVLGGPVAASIRAATGSWVPVFLIVAGLDVITAFLAIVVLRKLRTQWIAQSAPRLSVVTATG